MRNKPEKIIVIPDSFKGTLSSTEICDICENKIKELLPGCEVVKIPVADGGEGTVDCFLQCLPCEKVSCRAAGPYGEPLDVYYARYEDTAFIELAMTAGLPLVEGRMDPTKTSTYGVGEMMAHAIRHGCRKIILGVGGSCTTDGGCGIAAALGVRFYNRDGLPFIPTGGTLSEITRIDCDETLSRPAETTHINSDESLSRLAETTHINSGESLSRLAETTHINSGETLSRPADVEIITMCDIDNPMFGPEGAAYVFAPQKGADPEMVKLLDDNLKYLSERIICDLGVDVSRLPGAGAAGAVGAGMAGFLGSRLQSGINTVLETVRFDELLDGADLVITGEGCIDTQSLRGKVVIGIAEQAKKKNVPVLAIVGTVGEGAEAAYSMGVTSIISINRKAEDFSVSRYKSRENLEATVDAVLRLIRA